MKIYLAAQYTRRNELRGYKQELQAKGHQVVSTWLEEEWPLDTDLPSIPFQEAVKMAQRDLGDVSRCDLFVALSESPLCATKRGGRHVETGMALQMGKQVAVIGERENIFHFLPGAQQFDTWEGFLDQLKEFVPPDPSNIRTFATGATRDADTGKFDFQGFCSSTALRAFGEYMHRHRIQANGTLRASDNWKSGIPLQVYMASAFRHFVDWWLMHEGYAPISKDCATFQDALCGLWFNVQGYLYEWLKAQESR